ncbi:hypothetical protein [Escherichia coli]|uniref:hypothetical protein n=1 Tax=Escherichia coli TaxID=562 RepID=UPI00388F9943
MALYFDYEAYARDLFWTPSPLLTVMCSVGDLLPAPAGSEPARPPENPAGLRLPEMQEGRACACPSCPSWCEAFFCYVVSVVLISGGGDTFGSRLLAASGRQARLRQAAAGAPASLRRTRWRGFGLPLRSDV